MHFIFDGTDKPNALETRIKNRPEHVKFLGTAIDHDITILSGGPRLNEMNQMCGSTLMLDAPSREILATWLAQDPYAKANLFEKTRIEGITMVFGG